MADNTPINLRIKFKKVGNLQYISHLDLVRTMNKIIVRSRLPLWYTEGFNPKPKMVFAAPLSTGVESMSEYMDLRLTERIDPELAKDALNRNMTEEMQAYATADAAAPMVNESSKSGVVGGTSVQVKDKIYTTFLFANSSLTSKNAAKVVVTYTKNNAAQTVVTKEIAVEDLEVNNASSKKLVVDDAAIADCSNPITVTVYDADGNVVGSAVDCVYYYASRQASDANGIFAALRKLITSAGIYFN